MARNELKMRLSDQIVEIDMALVTAGRDEADMLNSIRWEIEMQLEGLRAPHPTQLRAA